MRYHIGLIKNNCLSEFFSVVWLLSGSELLWFCAVILVAAGELKLSCFFLKNFSPVYLFFIFGCIGSSLLHVGFLWLWRAGSTLRCGAWASHRGGFSCCGARALGAQASVVAARGLSVCGVRAESAGSVVVVRGLSCSMACRIFLDQGANLCPLHWQADS